MFPSYSLETVIWKWTSNPHFHREAWMVIWSHWSYPKKKDSMIPLFASNASHSKRTPFGQPPAAYFPRDHPLIPQLTRRQEPNTKTNIKRPCSAFMMSLGWPVAVAAHWAANTFKLQTAGLRPPPHPTLSYHCCVVGVHSNDAHKWELERECWFALRLLQGELWFNWTETTGCANDALLEERT